MKKAYCDKCGREVESYMVRYLSYQNDSPQYNGQPAEQVRKELCTTCNEKIVTAIINV